MFLIISSSIYPAITSSIENKELLLIPEAVAQLQANRNVDTSSYHADLSTSSSATPSLSRSAGLLLPEPTAVSPASSNVTAQAALQIPRSFQTNNIVDARAVYEVTFITATTGVIETVEIVFPADTNIAPAGLIERVNIGSGSFIKAGTTLTYNVNNPVSIPAGTFIRFEIANMDNPSNPSSSYSTTITTRNPSNAIIDGPTQTGVYPIEQIDTQQIADDSVIDAKLSLDSVYTIWDDTTGGNNDILYMRKTVAFDPIVDLSNNAGTSMDPAIAAAGNNVHVVWDDNTLGNPDIFYRRSTNGGANFGETINLSNSAASSSSAAIAVSGNNVYVVWHEIAAGNIDIFYRRSTDGGANFSATVNLSNNAGLSAVPDIATSGNNVYVVWQDDTPGNIEILYRRSTDSGATFSVIESLSNIAGSTTNSAIATSGNNVYVVWHDDTPGNSEILYRRSTDGGANFDATVNLSNNAGISAFPNLATSGKSVYVVWHDTTAGNFEVFYRRSTDNGATFDVTANLSDNAGSSGDPVITTSANNVYVAWSDTTLGINEILYRRSTDGGAGFGDSINISNNAGFSQDPDIASANNLT